METANNNLCDHDKDPKVAKGVTFKTDTKAEAVQDSRAEQEELSATEIETDSEQAAIQMTPEPFEPAGQPAASASPEPRSDTLAAEGGGAVRKSVNYPDLDIRKSKREERQRKKAEVEGAIARMVTDSAMREEVAMEMDQNGKNLNLGWFVLFQIIKLGIQDWKVLLRRHGALLLLR
jgi:hypothetical protein